MTESEKEILLIAQEECAEVTQAISKVFRFGFDAVYPETSVEDNRTKLAGEIGDLLAMFDLMYEKNLIDENAVQLAISQKKAKLKIWSSIYNKPNLELVKN